jgi:hypothetical protein
VHTITIELPREHLWQIRVPDLIGAFRKYNAVGFLLGIHRIE